MKKEKVEIIKPKKEKKEKDNILTPIIYIILGIILAFRSNEAVELVFYIIGIISIIYGIKSFITYYQNKISEYNKINLSIAIISILIGILIIVLSKALETSIRYILGFFMIYFAISRILTNYSLKSVNNNIFSNILLLIAGIFSIFVSNIILVVIGWILIINAIILFIEYFKK